MTNGPDSDWNPDPQMLAAYFDGELEGRDDLADVRARLEAWLDAHPEAAGTWAKHQQLKKLWLETTPAEPNPATWNQTLDQIAAHARQPTAVPGRMRPWLAASIVAASIVLFIGLLLGALRILMPTGASDDPFAGAPKDKSGKPDADEMEVFPVATADEVVIRRVEGADTSLLVVGRPPVDGPLELAGPGEVYVVQMRPDADDRMVPKVRQKGPPMIWLDTDD